MFLGQFYHNLDDKGRLTVPSRYRDLLLPAGAYIMQGFDQNLIVLPSENYEEQFQRIRQIEYDGSRRSLAKTVILFDRRSCGS